MSILYIDMTQLESFLMKDQDLPISHSRYHGCWLGDARSQGIGSHDIDKLNRDNSVPPR